MDQYALKLSNHTNQPLGLFVLDGISQGFRVGYLYPHKLKSALINKPSAYSHLDFLDSNLGNEVSIGRVVMTSVALVSSQTRVNQENGA